MIVRDAFAGQPLPAVRFHDPSPLTIWLPFDWFVWDSIRAGKLPLWDRLQGGGYSPLVTFQAGVLHPIRWLGAAFPRALMPSVLIVVVFYLATLGWYLFGITLGLRPGASLTGALIFAFSPAVMSHVHYTGGFMPVAHMPWIMWLYRRMLASPTRWRFAAVAIAIGFLFLSGHPLIILTVCLLSGSFSIADSIATRRWKPMLLLMGAGVAGLALASVAVVPAVVAAPDSWSYKTASGYGLAYKPFSFGMWTTAQWYALFDGYDTSCCVDLPVYFGYVGWAMVILLVGGVVAAWRGAASRRFIVLALFWYLIAVPGPWMMFLRWLGPLVYVKPWYYSSALAFAMAVLAAYGFTFIRERLSGSWRLAAFAVAVATIGIYAARAYPVVKPRIWSVDARGPAVDLLRKTSDHYRITGLAGQVHRPNSSRQTGIEDVRLTAPSFYKRYRLWWWLVDPKIDRITHPTAPMTNVLDSPLVGDFNIRYIVQSRRWPTGWFTTATGGPRDAHHSLRIDGPQFPLVGRGGEVEIRANHSVKPRAHFAERVVVVPEMEAAGALLAEDRMLARTTSVVEATEPLSLPANARGRVRVQYPDDASVVLDVDSETGGLVVLHDTFVPGWSATIDGAAATIYPVNVLSRGVIVAPGRHRIEMRYMPPGLLSGAAMSAVTLLGLIALAATQRR